MRKPVWLAASVLAALWMLSGCAAFNREYVSVEDYVPSVQEQSAPSGKISVRNYNALRQALLNMAYSGVTEGSIVFDAAYDGDATEDMASACWAVRTQDALCAYCVENIAYELNKIVTISEAIVHISYSGMTESPENIRHLAFSSEAETQIVEAMDRNERRLALLVGRSGFSADDMAAQVIKAYRENPTVVPKEPEVSVNIYSGSGSQRLYEILFRYGLTQEELDERAEQLRELEPFAGLELGELDEAQRAVAACAYLTRSCTLCDSNSENNAYSALIRGEADSEGVAFAYVELCRRLELDCRIVYGQRDWKEHCWNIVEVDGSFYHVDVTQVMSGGPEAGFLLNDEHFWGLYRWDVASYPECTGTLSYRVLAEAGAIEAEQIVRGPVPEEEPEPGK